jgi:hypothetical protein
MQSEGIPMNEDVLMMIAMVTGAVLIVGHLARTRRARLLQETIREAIRSNSPITEALLDKIDEQPQSATSDDRIGLVLIALGAALFCYGLLRGNPEEFREIAGIALFPIFVGSVLLARFAYLSRQSERP